MVVALETLQFVAQTLFNLHQYLVSTEPFDEIAKAHLVTVVTVPVAERPQDSAAVTPSTCSGRTNTGMYHARCGACLGATQEQLEADGAIGTTRRDVTEILGPGVTRGLGASC